MKKYSIDDLRDIMVQLRGENGCPWDKVKYDRGMLRGD